MRTLTKFPVAAALSLVSAQTTTQDPSAGTSVFGAVPDSWNMDAGCVPEFDLRAWAAGAVTLTNVELFAGVLHTDVVADTTFTAAADNIVTAAAHGRFTGDGPFYVSSTTTLPGGLAGLTPYWVVRLGANTFSWATSLANALAGSVVDITSNGSGTHTYMDSASTQSIRWESMGLLESSLALTLRKGYQVRCTADPHAVAYAMGYTNAAGVVAVSFTATPVMEK